jgi:hypothetical protein
MRCSEQSKLGQGGVLDVFTHLYFTSGLTLLSPLLYHTDVISTNKKDRYLLRNKKSL